MGDFNAKIGMDNNGYEVMGIQGVGEMNENEQHYHWGEACSHIKGSTRPHGCHLIT